MSKTTVKGNKMKKVSTCFFVIATILVSVLMNGCTVSLKRWNTQNEKQYVVWQSEKNDDGIVLQFSVYRERSSHFGTVSFNNETYDIAMVWGDLSFNVSKINYYGKEYAYNDFSGRYTIKADNTVELEITRDYIYGGALCGKTIVVNAYDMEDTVHDVAVLHEVCWEAENDLLTLYTYQGMRNFSVGSYSDGSTQYNLVVYWLSEGSFEAYELSDGVQQSYVVMYGKYICGKDTLELTYRTSDDGAERTLLLTAREILNQEYPNEIWYPVCE